MATTTRRHRTTALVLGSVLSGVLAACSPATPGAAPTSTVTVTAPTSSAAPAPSSAPPSPTSSSSTAAHDCPVNPSTAPMPNVEPYGTVPEVGRITVRLNGIPSGILRPGGAPTEVEVSLCNDSAVDYPAVGVVLVLEHCSCAPNPMSIPQGTVERWDDATDAWIRLDHPAVGGGMDYLGTYADVQPLPKGTTVTVRYRVALDASMTAGEGGLEAVAVTPAPLVQLGTANLAFAVAG